MIKLRPKESEYSQYYKKYVDLVEDENIVGQLKYGLTRNVQFFSEINADKWDFRYDAGKWSVKGVVQHLIDTERVMSYRALRVSRNDKTELPGFDQDEYMNFVNVDLRNSSDLIEEFMAVRKASISLFSNLEEEAWTRSGIASGGPITPLSLAYIIAGHELHHVDVLKKKYL